MGSWDRTRTFCRLSFVCFIKRTSVQAFLDLVLLEIYKRNDYTPLLHSVRPPWCTAAMFVGWG